MILLNDRFVDRSDIVIDIEDRGYQFGDGVYEVIRVYEGECFTIDPHLQRLKRSTEEIEIALPYELDEIKQKLLTLIDKNGLKNGHIYLQITRGVAPRAHHFPEQSEAVFVAYTNETERPVNKIRNGIRTVTTEDIRWLRCDIKSLNLLGNVLGKQQAKKQGCEEAVFHRGDTVTEGSSSNVFIINEDTLQTHPANHLILNGITRMEVLDAAKELGMKVKEEPFTVDELKRAQEVFITSTTMEITPVTQIDDSTVGSGVPGAATKNLQAAFEKRIGAFNKSNA